MVKQKQYEAFGNLKWQSGTYSDNREFTGKEKDKTGFHYFGARYYSGDIRRFLSPDPIVLHDLTNPQSLNPYAYCYNSPLNFTDPTGMIVTWGEGINGSAWIEDWEKNNPYLYEQYKQLNESENEYLVEYGEVKGDKEGNFSYNGKQLLITIEKGGKLSVVTKLSHEFEHGLQFERGEVGFIDRGNGWEVVACDLMDEIGAWNASLKAAPDRDYWDFNARGKSFLGDYRDKSDLGRISFLKGLGEDYNKLPLGPINVNLYQITHLPGLKSYKVNLP